MFKWKKRGLIFSPNGMFPWMHSHAQCPFPLLFEDRVRVYFSTREAYQDSMSRAYGGYVDLDIDNLSKVISVSSNPILKLGELGEFDEFGSMPGTVIRHGDEFLLYYCGWSRSQSTPYRWEIGLAKSHDGLEFFKCGRGPLLSGTLDEPYLHACPIVYRFDADRWHMFYLSGVRWLRHKDKVESQYVLMHAQSDNGLEWKRNAIPILPEMVEYESQTSAAIIKMDNAYHMFFSFRNGLDFREKSGLGYRIGYAYSSDLISWRRDDSRAGIELSKSGWDSKMLAYPHIVKIKEQFVMFYCGNDFGREGFGYAELEI